MENTTLNTLLKDKSRKFCLTCEEYLQQIEPHLIEMREDLWHINPLRSDDIDELHDVLVAFEILKDPTLNHIKAFFMMLPLSIIGHGQTWGFSGNEVRERIYEFVEQNKKDVFERITSK